MDNGHTKKVGEVKIKNELEKCERSNNHDIEVWINDSNEKKNIKPGDDENLEFDPNSDVLKLHVKTVAIPANNGVKGIKIIPGWGPGEFHHIDTVIKGNKLHTVLYYDLSDVNKKNKENKDHKDPTVVHPDEPGGS